MAETTHEWNDFALKMTRGDQRELDLAVKKYIAGVESAQDLTGGVVWVTGKRDLGDSDAEAVFQLNSDELGGVEILSAGSGTARATFVPAHTSDLYDQQTLVYVDCCFVSAEGKPRTFQKGTITVYRDATISG